MPDITIETFHKLAKKAVDSMIAMSLTHSHGLNLFSEAQLVHEIGNGLKTPTRSWVAFEYPYLHKDDLEKRADIVTLERSDSGRRGDFHWIEVKFTGLDRRGNRKNTMSTLLKNDFGKLRKLDNRRFDANHFGYWAWLYFFHIDGQTQKIRKRFASTKTGNWSRRLPLETMAEIVKGNVSTQWTLENTLTQIQKQAFKSMSTCSCIPTLKDPKNGTIYTVLLTTCRVK